MLSEESRRNITGGVITFYPHPIAVINPEIKISNLEFSVDAIFLNPSGILVTISWWLIHTEFFLFLKKFLVIKNGDHSLSSKINLKRINKELDKILDFIAKKSIS